MLRGVLHLLGYLNSAFEGEGYRFIRIDRGMVNRCQPEVIIEFNGPFRLSCQRGSKGADAVVLLLPALSFRFNGFVPLLHFFITARVVFTTLHGSELYHGIGEYIVTFDDRYTAELCRSFDSSIENTQKQIIVPCDILVENPGVNPIALQKLLECFQYSEKTPEEFIPPLPENEDAKRSNLSASFAQKGVASW